MAARDDDDRVVEDLLVAERPRKPVEVQWALANLERELFGRKRAVVMISRYVLHKRLAAGGSGVVYAAFDPELDRRVAIKLLRPAPGSRPSQSAAPDLLLEARAVAQLAHPNVVTVHDVGVFEPNALGDVFADSRDAGETGVFMVMELVEGHTLAEWLAHGGRSWQEVLRVFIAAGRGLAAAHEAELVHRDFKPANVMLSGDGRVRVVDFGLARAAKEPGSDGEHTAAGTPLYMAPEQHRGDDLDARTDQYAFCVSLAEALLGRRPFHATSLDTLLDEKLARRADIGMVRAPGFVRAILLRGLEPDPRDRLASMARLLDGLERGLAGRRRRRLAIVAAPVIVLAGVGAVSIATDPEASCPTPESRLASVWDAPRKAAIGDAFAQSDKAYVPAAWQALARRLDAAAGEWADAYATACPLTMGVDPSPDAAARMLCLERELARIDAFAAVLESGTREVLDRAVANELPFSGVEPCVDPEGGGAAEPADREAALAFERTLAHAEALLLAGEIDETLRVIAEAVETAKTLDSPRATVDAQRLLALAQRERGDLAEALETAELSLMTAEAADLQREAIRATIDLVLMASYDAEQLAVADRWARLAEAKMTAHDPGPALQAKYANNVAVLRRSQGRHDEAIAQLERAVELTRELTGGDTLQVSRIESTLASMLHAAGHNAEAIEMMERAMTKLAAELGDRHPAIASAKVTLGAIALDEGRYADALSQTKTALDIMTDAFGPEHPTVATVLNNYGLALGRAGRFDEAIEALQRSVALKQTHIEPDAPRIANGLSNIGTMLMEAGRPEEAIDHFERALEMRKRRLGADHPDVGSVMTNLGTALMELGRADEAFEAQSRAYELLGRGYGEDNVRVMETRWRLGELQAQRGDREHGIANVEAAVRIGEGGRVDPVQLADARFALARLVARDDTSRSRTLAEAAVQGYANAPAAARQRVRVEQWLVAEGGRDGDE